MYTRACGRNLKNSIKWILPFSLSGLSPFLGDNDNETLNNILAAKWNFDEPEFADTSKEAKDFISRMLIVNKGYLLSRWLHAFTWACAAADVFMLLLSYSWRMGASEAMRHPWLSDSVLHHHLYTKVQLSIANSLMLLLHIDAFLIILCVYSHRKQCVDHDDHHACLRLIVEVD